MLVSCWANPGWKKGENVESEGRREETIKWQRKVPGFGQEMERVAWEKILFPFTSFSLAFTCFLFFAGGPTGLCSVLEAFGVNETAVLFERWRSAFLSLYSPVLTSLFSPVGNEWSHFHSRGPFILKQTPTSDCFVYDWMEDFRLHQAHSLN